MKSELKFTFDEDDGEEKLHRLVCIDDAFLTISQFQDYLRDEYKYNESLSEEVIDYIDLLRTHLYSLLEDNGINMDQVWS